MANLNKVMLIGNLTRDPELRNTPSGMAVTDLGMAVNRNWTDRNTNEKKEETVFIDVTCWGRTAEIACEYLSRGRPVFIEGRLTMDEWNDRETGQKRTKIKVTCESLQFLGNRSEGGGGGGWNDNDSSQSAPAQTNAGDSPAPASTPPDDEVPF